MSQLNKSGTLSSPLVSIIMPAFNSEKTISQSIQSVHTQSYENWELIIIDDASDDKTLNIIEATLLDERIKIISNTKNQGPAKARNLGLDLAKGEYIAFLDTDDFWAKEKLKIQVSFMQCSDYAISFTSYWRVDKTGLRKLYKKTAVSNVSYNNLLNNNSIGCLTSMYSLKKLPNIRFTDPSEFIETGNVNKALRRVLNGRVGHEDYVFWLTALRPTTSKIGQIAHGIDIPLAYYRVGASSVSSNKIRAALYQWFIYRYVENLPFSKSIWHFLRYSLSGISVLVNSRLDPGE